jgi:hypothetical protein
MTRNIDHHPLPAFPTNIVGRPSKAHAYPGAMVLGGRDAAAGPWGIRAVWAAGV